MKIGKILAIAVAVMLSVFTGCSDMIDSMAQVALRVTIDDHAIPLDSVFTLYKNREGSSEQTNKALGSVTDVTLIPLESGTWNLRVEARVDNVLKGEGSVTVTVKPGTTLPATIDLSYQYGLTFDANGGTSLSMAAKDVVYAESYGTLATATKTGYTLAGWNTQADGNGTEILSDTIVGITSPQTLYAKWTANTYSVSLDTQHGEDGSDALSATYNAPMPTATAPTRSGYMFGGYYDGTSGTGNQYYDATMQSVRIWDKVSATTLYAKWVSTVTFDGQDATTEADPAAKSVTYTTGTDTVGLLPVAPTRTGYTFDGWFTQIHGGGAEFTTATEVAGNLTVYAKWTANTHTVTFNKQDGDGGSDSVDAAYGSAMPAATEPSRTGYTFGGYYDGTGGNGKQYYSAAMASTSNWDKAGATTLYAKWVANSYTISFDSREGSDPDPATKDVYYDQAYGTLPAVTKLDLVLDGWYTAADGTGTKIDSTTVVSLTSNQTLYAKWRERTVGDYGQAGYIFYDDEVGYDFDGEDGIEDDEKHLLTAYVDDGGVIGARYLEAASMHIVKGSNQYFMFGYHRRPSDGFSERVGTDTTLGSGQTNTTALVSAMGASAYTSSNTVITTKTSDYAAKLCNDYTLGDYDDWFLPSMDELKVMYWTLMDGTYIGQSDKTYRYWSSSENLADGANDTAYLLQHHISVYGRLENGFITTGSKHLGADYSIRVLPIRAFR